MRSVCLLAVALSLSGCVARALDVPTNFDDALGCHATISGGFEAVLGDGEFPGTSLADIGGPEGILLNCNSRGDGATLGLALPEKRGPFPSVGATLQSDAAKMDCTSSDEHECNDWYGGTCMGDVIDNAVAAGEWSRGTFSCSMIGLPGFPAEGRHVVVSDGEFNIKMRKEPPR